MMWIPPFSSERCDANHCSQGYIEDSSPAEPNVGFSAEGMGKGGGESIDDLLLNYEVYPLSSNENASSFPLLNNQWFSEHMEIENAQFQAASSTDQPLERLPAIDHNLERSISEILELLEPDEMALPPFFSTLDFSSNGQSIYHEVDTIEGAGSELSTEEVMRVAALHFIQLFPHVLGDPTILRLPIGLSHSDLTGIEIKNIDLATLLLAAAEKVSIQQYDRASNLLHQCYRLSSKYGHPVQRIVYSFSEALQERIDRETGKNAQNDSKEFGNLKVQEVIKDIHANQAIHLTMHYSLPFLQILQFTAIQAILDNITSMKRIHMVDLSIQHGLQWTVLMQELATRTLSRIDSLKISAVTSSSEVVAATSKRLSTFAASLNLPFEFRTVIVPDMKDLREDMFELKEGEAVGVYSSLYMSGLIVKPESLENLMKVIQMLKPCVVTVIDVEAKHNSKSFINRFTEALFYFSALFDCLDTLIERNDVKRIMLEGIFHAQAIRNIIATEGDERVVRHVGISVWRDFFMRFGLVEAELSEWSLYKGSILLKEFPNCSDSCTLEKNGKSLFIGWKGTPMNFVSAWKFQKRRGR